jgi:hypothetical protein
MPLDGGRRERQRFGGGPGDRPVAVRHLPAPGAAPRA